MSFLIPALAEIDGIHGQIAMPTFAMMASAISFRLVPNRAMIFLNIVCVKIVLRYIKGMDDCENF